MTAHVVVQNLTVVLGASAALTDVSLTAETGEVVGIVGPNGAGKTTLLRTIAGDVVPRQGDIQLGGLLLRDYSLAELARRRAYLGPVAPTQSRFAVYDVVAMGRHPHAVAEAADDDDEVVAAALADTDVAHLSARPVRTLSTGERQRVGLARVLAQQTPLVLLDEPTSSLDLGHQELVMRRIRTSAATGTTVIVVLHDLNLAAAHTDRLVLLDGGRVRADGSPFEVLQADTLTSAYRQAVVVMRHPHRDCPLVLPVEDHSGAP